MAFSCNQECIARIFQTWDVIWEILKHMGFFREFTLLILQNLYPTLYIMSMLTHQYLSIQRLLTSCLLNVSVGGGLLLRGNEILTKLLDVSRVQAQLYHQYRNFLFIMEYRESV